MPAKSPVKLPGDETILSSVNFTLGDWKKLREILASEKASAADWVKAFHVLKERWKKRYLDPIEWIHSWNAPSKPEGEGFAIMTIACCLFEAVAAAYLGKVYHYEKHVRDKLSKWAYKDSDDCFLSVLNKHPAFQGSMTALGDLGRFYRGIRCGLLHEARTKAELIIRTNSKSNEVVTRNAKMAALVVNRHAFVTRLKKMINQMEADVRDDNVDTSNNSCRLNLARHMDWTFGLFDVDPVETLKAESTKPWWTKP